MRKRVSGRSHENSTIPAEPSEKPFSKSTHNRTSYASSRGKGETTMTIIEVTEIAIASAAVVTAFITLGIAILTRATLKEARNNSYADILFRLDEAFLHYENVREKLAPGGDWHRKKGDPTFPKGPNYTLSEDLIAISSYMGLFERIQKLIDRRIIYINEVDQWYGDRLINIVINDKIKNRLEKKEEGWSDFIKLWIALQKQRKQDSKRKWPDEALVPKALESN